jgi:hypothetical protein
MKIYTILSPSHQFLFDKFFLQSLKKYEPRAELIVVDQDQICGSGSYYDSGWKESMEQKIDTYLQAVNSQDDFFIWSDVDIEFHDKFIDQCVRELGDHDIAFQEGVGGEYCAGFFICRINSSTKKFFEMLKTKYQEYSCDQQAINHNIHSINAKFLSHKFLNISFQHRQWNGQGFIINQPIIMFHANYTVGLQHKIMLLSKVREMVDTLKLKQSEITRQQNNFIDVKILSAFYGLYTDVTEKIKASKDEIMISIDSLRSDPIPGAPKYLYCFDTENNLMSRPIKEGLTIRLK